MQIVFLIIVLIIIIFLIFNTLGFFTGAPFAPTPIKIINQALKLARVNKNDVVYDLGAGDGRLLISAAKGGARSVGWEMNPFLFIISLLRIKIGGVSNNANIHLGNFWNKNLKEATVIFVFILPEYMSKLETKLKKELKPGTKVVTHLARLPYKKPTRSVSGLNLYQF